MFIHSSNEHPQTQIVKRPSEINPTILLAYKYIRMPIKQRIYVPKYAEKKKPLIIRRNGIFSRSALQQQQPHN